MSVSEHALAERVARTAIEGIARLQRLLATLVGLLTGSVRAAAFWVATLLPLSYLPLLATGVTAEHPFGFVALLCGNGVAFVVGHGHKRSEAR